MWEIARANRQKSFFLAVFMWFFLITIGFVAGELIMGPGAGPAGLFIALIIWLVMVAVALVKGRTLILAISRAHKIEKKDHPRLFNIVEEMVLASQLPAMPEIYIIDDQAPNAFATGLKPEKSAIAVTTGLLNILNRDQLQGVIAHEIGHIKNRDIQFMTMMGVMLGAIVLLSDMAMRTLFWGGGRRRTSSGGGQMQAVLLIVGLALMILAPIIAQMIYLASSRKREFLADASSAIFTRYPEGLAGALEKIGFSPVRMKQVSKVTAPMYTVNPIVKLNAAGLFGTHPPIDMRVRILRSMGGGTAYLDYNKAYQAITNKGQSILPKSALTAKPSIPVMPGGEQVVPHAVRTAMPQPGIDIVAMGTLLSGEEPAFEKKVRESTDAIWKSRNYRFIDCSCGAVLKVPPELHKTDIQCLRCGTAHKTSDIGKTSPSPA